MGPDLLLNPTPKKRPAFERRYPFPIVRPSGVQSSSGENWKCVLGHLQESSVIVSDEQSIKMLYSMGFYGKGTLSKGMPQVCAVYDSTMQCSGKKRKFDNSTKSIDSSGSTSFKKTKNEEDEEIDVVDTSEPIKKEKKKSGEIEVLLSDDSSSSDSSSENSETMTQSEEKESLQLMFEEAFFLSYGLGCLVVMDKDQPLDLLRLWHKLCDLSTDQNFPVVYTAYHHFRSKGWIVRNGLKYGSDYVLYKDGPPFYHSTYAVIVKAVKEKHLKAINKNGQLPMTWASLSALNRINTHAAKAVMFLYVIKPEAISENKVSTPFCISHYKLQEVLVKRWVPSEGREEET